jgi:D-cysteine desulfhydrase
MGSELPLVRRFPGLAALARIPFVEVPTPVEALHPHGIETDALWVKRDDRSGPLYGGNKPRKLEFVIGAAAARGSRRLVTTGGIGTHHGLATTLLGRTQRMTTTLVLVPQPLTAHVQEQLAAILAFGAEIRFARGVASAAAQVAAALARSAARGERPTFVPTGGSSALGDVGFVSAAFELAEQIEAGALPAPREVFVPVGSGGTLAGLVLGAKLAGLGARWIGVLVTDILPPSPRRLARLARATLRRLRGADPRIPEVALAPDDFEITRAQLGAGYGAPTQAARAAAAACAPALRLDEVYTSKCMAEVLARLRDGRARGPVLFWHTYNSVDFRIGMPAPSAAGQLPAPLRRWLARAREADA